MAVEGGGGGVGGRGYWRFQKKTSCRMISKEKISALKKKISWRIMLGTKLTPLYDGENS